MFVSLRNCKLLRQFQSLRPRTLCRIICPGLELCLKFECILSVYILAVHSLMKVESVSFACVKSLEHAGIRFILFVFLCNCKIAAPIPKLESSHIG